MECCNFTKNLIPIIYEYTNKRNEKIYGVSHFICTECMSNICVDDSFDKKASNYNNINDYAFNTLIKYNIEEYR